MLDVFDVLPELYPDLQYDDYSRELDFMLQHNYGQVAVFEENTCLGLTGFWIGNKLWCGRYMELDNVIIRQAYRSSGVGDLLFDYMRNFASEEKCNLLALDSYSDNFKAHKFFYRKNYVPRGFHFIHVLNPENIR